MSVLELIHCFRYHYYFNSFNLLKINNEFSNFICSNLKIFPIKPTDKYHHIYEMFCVKTTYAGIYSAKNWELSMKHHKLAFSRMIE